MPVGYDLPGHLANDRCAGQRSCSQPAEGAFPKSIDPACNLCVTDCQDEECVADEPCTDECFVVACNDPSHGGSSCECELAPQGDYYNDVLDALFGCGPQQTDRSLHASDPALHLQPSISTSPDRAMQEWNQGFEAFLCSCGGDFPSQPSRAQPTSSAIDFPASYSSPMLSDVSDTLTPSMPSTPRHSASTCRTDCTRDVPHQPFMPQVPPGAPSAVSCMWNNCGAQFSTLAELVGHVNLSHLHPSPTPEQSALSTDNNMLYCQWGNCNDYPTPQSIPGSSSNTSVEDALGVLSEHLFHDHLGINQPVIPLTHPSSSRSSTPPPPAPSFKVSRANSSLPQSDTDLHDAPREVAYTGGENAVCRWQACGMIFGSVDELTSHITAQHVGSGRAHYDCFWDGCCRHGDKGFSSKQKICRHLQSHTGHRPFQCKLCKQNFSEAATLQQHMRRHTQEKPYVCDEPGCGKAFAIAGALTIHKRTHNGDKPFKCSFCQRAFSESSNLSKHLRTHTGVRPYPCSAPGCTKAFSRPDQLARHLSVHKK